MGICEKDYSNFLSQAIEASRTWCSSRHATRAGLSYYEAQNFYDDLSWQKPKSHTFATTAALNTRSGKASAWLAAHGIH
jgi:hypothetical protein